MIVPKNIQFTILVKLDGRMREMNFRRRADDLYDVDTTDESGRRWTFKWILKNEQWELEQASPILPSWIANNIGVIRAGFLTELL